MTTNQIRALELQETERHNREMEGLQKEGQNIEKAGIPAKYVSAVGGALSGATGAAGTLLRGFGSFKDTGLKAKTGYYSRNNRNNRK